MKRSFFWSRVDDTTKNPLIAKQIDGGKFSRPVLTWINPTAELHVAPTLSRPVFPQPSPLAWWQKWAVQAEVAWRGSNETWWRAIWKSNSSKAQRLWSAGISASTLDQWQMARARKESLELFTAVLGAGGPPNLTEGNHQNEALLHQTVRSGDVERTRLLVAAGASVDIVDSEGYTPFLAGLHTTVGTVGPWKLRCEAMQILLDAGANALAVNTDKEGALHMAPMNQHVEWLFALGIPATHKNRYDEYPLVRALSATTLQDFCTWTTNLIRAGADINQVHQLHIGPDQPLISLVLTNPPPQQLDPQNPHQSRRLERLAHLIEEGASLRWRGNDGKTILHHWLASQKPQDDDRAILEKLWEADGEWLFNQKDNQGNWPEEVGGQDSESFHLIRSWRLKETLETIPVANAALIHKAKRRL